MVLRWLACAALVAGCNQSLFDHGSTPTGGDDAQGPTTCPAPCVADAASDFDGGARGSTQLWRYLDDHRDHTWTALATGPTMTGASMNKITTCATTPGAPACARLPGSLLFTSSGATSPADPAIELTAPTQQVLQLALRVHVPSDGRPQVVRLYRSAREDSLFTGTAMPGATLEAAVTVDALAGDRFLFSLAPTALGTTDVAVQMFVSETGDAFPKQCQLALTFEPTTVTGTQMKNQCGSAMLQSWNDASDPEVMVAPAFAPGPFTESGMAGDFAEGHRLDSMVAADRSGDTTTQFWMKVDTLSDVYAAIGISDMDLDDNDPGGIAIDVFQFGGAVSIEGLTCTQGSPTLYTQGTSAYPQETAWHFIRVVQKGDKLTGCLDGNKTFEADVPKGSAVSNYPLRIGRNSVWNPQASHLDGKLDDLRFFKGVALPCE